MSRVQVVQVTCDYCGYGGALSRPDDFVQHGGFDFCRWCADTTSKRSLGTGDHEIAFDGPDAWLCSCGQSWHRPLVPFGIERAVPELANATAHVHLERAPIIRTAVPR